MWVENPHGMGFMASVNGKLLLRKGFFNFKSFWKVFREFQAYDKVVHFRWGNIGKINVENCHPFIVSERIGMAHNGTIAIPVSNGKSDTRTFTERILRRLNEDDPNFLEDGPTRWFLSKSIGQSKLVFLTAEGNITIINKAAGEEFNGVWYSNTDYKKWPIKVDKSKGINPNVNNNNGNNNNLYRDNERAMMGFGCGSDY